MSRYDREARSKIRWHSRRGLLELDLILTENDFLDLVNGKFDLEDPDCQAIVERLRHG